MALTAGVATLGLDALRRVPPEARPRIRPGSVGAGIVHLGLGAFHRAHQAVYTEDAIAEAGGDWGIVGVAPRSAVLIDRIAAQDNLFSVTSRSGAGARTRVVGSLAGARHAPSDPMAVVALLADPAIRVVTLTVTEKAYRLDPATGVLRADDDVLADLSGKRPPGTVPGLLARGLTARAHADAGPIALVSCDNLPDNGRRLHAMVSRALELANGRAGAVGPAWVAANVTFPGTTIDRIVPATTAETLAEARAALGVTDLAAVAAEPYRQWVIEDSFLGDRPAWERAGAVLTGDVTPWERLKLRTLNGVHSALAYLGALAGCETIADALALPGMAGYLRRLIAEEIATSFAPPPGVTVVEYGESVLERFANPAIRHRTLQVAMDGTQKLPQRILHTMLDRRAAGGEPRWGALAVAAWMRFAAGVADDGRELPLDDPLATEIRHTLRTAPDPEALLGLDRVFPVEFSGDPTLRRLVLGWLHDLGRLGAAATIRAAAS
jgi:fructuronate reductase